MRLLHTHHRGVTSNHRGDERFTHGAQFCAVKRGKIGFGSGVEHFYVALFHAFGNLFQILARRTASVVANAPHAHRFFTLGTVREVLVDLLHRFSLKGAVTVPKAMHGNGACIKSAPQKVACKPLGAFGKIALKAALIKNLHKSACVTKGVHVHCNFGFYAKLFFKVFAAERNLREQAFARGHHAVGLEVPTANNVPFAVLNKLLNTRKKGRLVFFYPFVEQSLVVIENIAVVFLAKVCRYTKSGNRLGKTLIPSPKPGRVEVCV